MSENGEFAPGQRDIASMLGVDPDAASSHTTPAPFAHGPEGEVPMAPDAPLTPPPPPPASGAAGVFSEGGGAGGVSGGGAGGISFGGGGHAVPGQPGGAGPAAPGQVGGGASGEGTFGAGVGGGPAGGGAGGANFGGPAGGGEGGASFGGGPAGGGAGGASFGGPAGGGEGGASFGGGVANAPGHQGGASLAQDPSIHGGPDDGRPVAEFSSQPNPAPGNQAQAHQNQGEGGKNEVDREITKDTDLKADETVTLPDGTMVDTGKNNTKISSENGPTITVKKDGTVEVREVNGDAVSVRTLDQDGKTTLSNGTTIVSKDGVTTVTLASGDKIVIDKDGKTNVDIAADLTEPEQPGDDPGAGDGAGGGSPSGGGGSPSGGGGGDTGGGGGGDTGGGSPSGPGGPPGPSEGQTPPGNPSSLPGNIEVSAQAMRSDAKAWDAIGEDFTEVGGGVDDLRLDKVDFGLAFVLHSGYDAITTKFGELVDAGTTEFQAIADMLRRNAKDYDDTESQNVDATTHIVEV